VQEALLRVHQALDAGEQIASPRALVATVTTRLAINAMGTIGKWMGESCPFFWGGCRFRLSPIVFWAIIYRRREP
jgi:hypothetical protein